MIESWIHFCERSFYNSNFNFFGDMMNIVNLADLGILFYFIVNSIRVYLKLKDLTPSFITLWSWKFALKARLSVCNPFKCNAVAEQERQQGRWHGRRWRWLPPDSTYRRELPTNRRAVRPCHAAQHRQGKPAERVSTWVVVVRELFSLVMSTICARIGGHRSEVMKIVYHMAQVFGYCCREHFHFILLGKH